MFTEILESKKRCKLSTVRVLYRDDFGEAKNEYILRYTSDRIVLIFHIRNSPSY